MSFLVNPHRFSVAADNLVDLFANGEIGDFWIFDDVYTDGNNDGDPVTTATGAVNGRVLEDAGTSPTLESISGRWAVQTGPGGGSRLFHALGSTVAQPGTIILCSSSGELDTHSIVTGSLTTLRWQISTNSGGDIIAFAGSSLDSTINENYATQVFAVEFNGASSKFRVNGTQTAAATTGTQSTNQITIGALWDGTSLGTTQFYALLFINRLLTASELDRAERMLGSKGGVTW